ncbi:MAG: hypothetical protein IJD78_04815 [Clostridia bacterium]|nr:hypothetical protein [Clostridia bacterium]
MKKSKYLLMICGIAAVITAGVSFSKTVLPNAISETSTPSAVSESADSHSTEKNTSTTVERTEKEQSTTAVANAETTNEAQPTTHENTTHAAETTTKAFSDTITFPIQIPTLRIPEIFTPSRELPTTPSGEIDLSCFDNCAFVGNSRFISFKNYGLAKNVYSVVGLNVDTVFTKSCSGSNVTVINELNGKNFDKIILMFGDNECGWPNQNIFIERYSKVIKAVRDRVPRAEIFLHGILPVSSAESEENNYGVNNSTIAALNQKIKQLAADEGIGYIAPPSSLLTENGALISEAASDGVHLNKSYSKKWLFAIAEDIY